MADASLVEVRYWLFLKWNSSVLDNISQLASGYLHCITIQQNIKHSSSFCFHVNVIIAEKKLSSGDLHTLHINEILYQTALPLFCFIKNMNSHKKLYQTPLPFRFLQNIKQLPFRFNFKNINHEYVV